MSTCSKCGFPLKQPPSGGSPVCQRCMMTGLLHDPDTISGSNNSDDYEMREEIGRGADGTVYLAYDHKVGRLVALKFIRSPFNLEPDAEARFRSEIEAIARLDHPNIIPIYANGELDGRPFYTMKHVSGGNLATQLDHFSSPHLAAALMGKLACAVHHAHERGILHRDLKPSNILLDEEHEPYISDFGLAKHYDKDQPSLTLTGSVMGTPAYMSPEQARGDKLLITTSSDIFSLGSIFFQLLTGRHAFPGENSHAVLRSVIETEIHLPKEDSQKIDRDLETILLKCLEKDPEKRYSSALELALDIERWQRGEPVEARRISTAERLMRWVRRHPLSFAALSFALLSLAAGIISGAYLWRQAVSAQHLAEDASKTAIRERDQSEENAAYVSLSNALSARERFDFGEARRILQDIPPQYREFEWHLIKNLSRGDQDWTIPFGDSAPVKLVYDSSKNRILLLTEDRHIHALDPETQILTPVGRLPLPPSELRSPRLKHFALSPDGRHYSFSNHDDLYFVESASHQIVFQTKSAPGHEAAWLDDSRLLLCQLSDTPIEPLNAAEYEDSAWIIHLPTQKKIPLPPMGWNGSIAISPDRTLIALVHNNREIKIFRMGQGFQTDPLHQIRLPNKFARQISFSPDGLHLTYSAQDTSGHADVVTYDLENQLELMNQIIATRPLVASSHQAPSGFITMSGREPWFSHRRYLKNRNLDNYFNDGHRNSTTHLPNGPFTPPTRLLTRSTADSYATFFGGHGGPIETFLHLPDSDTLISASRDGSLRGWSLDHSKLTSLRRAWTDIRGDRRHPIVSHNGDYCFYQSMDHGPLLWHRPSGQLLRNLPKHTQLAVLNDGTAFTRHNTSGEVHCWKIIEGQKRKLLWRTQAPASHPDPEAIQSSVTPDERYLAVLHSTQILFIDVQRRSAICTPLQTLGSGTLPGRSISLSSDGKFIAVTGFEGPTARLYPTETLAQGTHQFLIPDTLYSSRDSACALTHDGKRLYVGNNDGRVRVFDVSTRKEIAQEGWQVHNSEITALTLSQKGDIIATAGGHQAVLWSTKKQSQSPRRKRLTLNTGNAPRVWMRFCDEDSLFLHAGFIRPIEVWEAHRTLKTRPNIPVRKPISDPPRPLKTHTLTNNRHHQQLPPPSKLKDLASAFSYSALNFDGHSQYLSIPSRTIPIKNEFTLEAWFMAREYTPRVGLVTKTENSEYGLFVSNACPEFFLYLNGSYTILRPPKNLLKTGQWHHLAGVYDGQEARLYLDGKLVMVKKCSGPRRTNGLPLIIGGDVTRSGISESFFNGLIDTVRLSSTARYHGGDFLPQRDFQLDKHTKVLLDMEDLQPGAVPNRVLNSKNARSYNGPQPLSKK